MSKKKDHRARLNYMIAARWGDDLEPLESVRNVKEAHRIARNYSEEVDNPIEVTGRPNKKMENYFVVYEYGIPQCPKGMEFVAGYRKKDGTRVHPFCRKEKEDIGSKQERQMIDAQERGIYEAETDYTGEKTMGRR